MSSSPETPWHIRIADNVALPDGCQGELRTCWRRMTELGDPVVRIAYYFQCWGFYGGQESTIASVLQPLDLDLGESIDNRVNADILAELVLSMNCSRCMANPNNRD